MKEITYKKWFDAFEFIKNTDPLEFDIYVQLNLSMISTPINYIEQENTIDYKTYFFTLAKNIKNL